MPQPPVTAAALAPGSLVAVAGASARAAAGSLRRAGLVPICADMFCDRDLITHSERAAACPPGRFPDALPDVLDSLNVPRGSPLLLTGAMENHLAVVRRLAERFALFTSIDAMEAVRDPLLGKKMPMLPGLIWPETRPGPIPAMRPRAGSEWLIKPRRSAGGRGIRLATRDVSVDERHVVQRKVNGVAAGFVYIVPVAGRFAGRAVPIAGTIQMLGDEHFGATGFQYAGSLGLIELTDSQIHSLGTLGDALASRFLLTGIFGVDAVLDRAGQLQPVEINPRYPASVEMLESTIGLSVFSMLRGDPMQAVIGDEQVRGKAIVHAKVDCKALDLYGLFPHDAVADVPDIGCEVAAGHPICTVFAMASNREECLGRLRAMAHDVYTRGVS